MTRRSKRELERAVEELEQERTTPDRPPDARDSLNAEEKEALNELFDMDPWGESSPEEGDADI